MLAPPSVILANSPGTCLETILRVLTTFLASSQDTWPRIVVRVLHLLCAFLAISQDMWLEIADPKRGRLVVRGARARAEDEVLDEDSMEVEVEEVK